VRGLWFWSGGLAAVAFVFCALCFVVIVVTLYGGQSCFVAVVVALWRLRLLCGGDGCFVEVVVALWQLWLLCGGRGLQNLEIANSHSHFQLQPALPQSVLRVCAIATSSTKLSQITMNAGIMVWVRVPLAKLTHGLSFYLDVAFELEPLAYLHVRMTRSVFATVTTK
jgi:hypothetical protein